MKPFPNRSLNFNEAHGVGKLLWEFGKLLHDEPKYAKPTNWILTYRYAVRAMQARIVTVDRDYQNLNALGGGVPPVEETITEEDRNEWNVVWESYAGVLFFAMDSSLECFSHALNALGYLINPAGFIDITDEAKLKRITPGNLFDPPGKGNSHSIHGQCNAIFPKICAHWTTNRTLLAQIIAYHDATKHRHSVVVGYGGNQLGHLVKLAPKQAMRQIVFDRPDGMVPFDEENSLQSITTEYHSFIAEWLRVTQLELESVFGQPRVMTR